MKTPLRSLPSRPEDSVGRSGRVVHARMQVFLIWSTATDLPCLLPFYVRCRQSYRAVLCPDGACGWSFLIDDAGMGYVLHSRARTTSEARREVRYSQESLLALSKRYGVNPKPIEKWRKEASFMMFPWG